MITVDQYEKNRNYRSRARDALVDFISNISISNIDTIMHQLGMLSMITSQTDEITRKAEVDLLFKQD